MSATVTGADCDVDPGATVGYGHDDDTPPTRLGADATVRAGTVLYADVAVGDRFATGHNAVVREATRMGDDVLVGTSTVVDGHVETGSRVSMQTGVYVPQYTTVGDDVFLGPHAVLTNDPYPLRTDADLTGPHLGDGVSVGANATILPGVAVGENAFVAAGSVVTDDVPPDTLALGAPATHHDLPEQLQGGNAQ